MNLFEYVKSINQDVEIFSNKPHCEMWPFNVHPLLTNKRYGMLKVSGYNAESKKWIARCICGSYLLKKESTFSKESKCIYCKTLASILEEIPDLKGVFNFNKNTEKNRKNKIRKKERRAKEKLKNEKLKNESAVIISKPIIKTKLFITYHAAVRYIERIEKVPIRIAKKTIKSIIETNRPNGRNNFSLVFKDCLFLVRNNRVITIINHNYHN